MTRTQEKRTNTKHYLKDGSEHIKADWEGTPFKYISQRGSRFRVRLTIKKGYRINRYFRSLVDAQDFVAWSGFALIQKTAQEAKGREGVA